MATATKNKGKSKNKATETPAVNNKVKPFEPTVKVVETKDISPNNLILTDKFRGRSQPVAQEEVYVLAEQLLKRQNQPIQVRAIPNSSDYEVVFGNTRTLAGKAIVDGFKLALGEDGGKEKEFPAVPNFTLRAEVVEVDDEEAVMRNITENVHRVNTSAIDDALNQEMLRNDYGMSDAAITRLYGYGHQASVTQLKKLLMLPEDIQKRIHEGNMTKQAGFLLADWAKRKGHVSAEDNKVKPEVIDTILANVKGGEDVGNVGSSEIAQCIKEWEKAQKQPETPTGEGTTEGATDATGAAGTTSTEGAATPTAPATTFALTLKDYKDTLTEFAGLPDVSAKMAEYCAVTLSFLKGEIEKDAYYDWVSTNIV